MPKRKLTDAGLGEFLVSGLKAGKPDATNLSLKPTRIVSRQAPPNDDHSISETQTLAVVVQPDATSRPPKPTLQAPRQANLNGDYQGVEPHRMNVAVKSGAATTALKPKKRMLRQATQNDGQPKRETHPPIAVIGGGGTRTSLQTTLPVSRRRRHIASDDHLPTETQGTSVVGNGGGGTKKRQKPTVQASRHQDLSAGQFQNGTQPSLVGGDGDDRAQIAVEIPAGNSPVIAAGGGTSKPTKSTKRLSRRQSISDDQTTAETHLNSVVGNSDDRAQFLGENQHKASPVIAQLIQAARLRRRWHKAEKSLTLQGRALCRSWTGGDKDAANALFDRVQAGENNDPILSMALTPFLATIGRFTTERKAIQKDLRKLARQLPVWDSFAEGVKGLGDLRLALIVGECGDIGGYRNPSCLWKRMGLAVINGERQRRKTDPEEALLNGYNAERRAMGYVLGTELLKAQLRAPKDANKKRIEGVEPKAIGPYGELYLERKAYELAREIPKAHAHNRAARFMVKRLFRELFAAWRRT